MNANYSAGIIEDFNNDFVDYSFATEPGLSGSPLIIDNMYIIGLHLGKHKGKNFGININESLLNWI